MTSQLLLKKPSPWLLLCIPPVIFLLVIMLFSAWFGAQSQGDPGAIAEQTAQATPSILVTVQILLLALLLITLRRQGLTLAEIGWRSGERGPWRELMVGALIGAPLGAAWIVGIEPVLTLIQRALGDYVPAGAILPALGAAIIPFAIADVLLAPGVEESIYRGYALALLPPRYGAARAIVISSLLFGLLHWPGGFWYILTTALLVGVPFAILRQRRGSLYAAFGAHLALNLVETLLLWLR